MTVYKGRFTPKPWVAVGRYSNKQVTIREGGSRGRPIATIGKRLERSTIEKMANARLITQAPVMFELIQHLANGHIHGIPHPVRFQAKVILAAVEGPVKKGK